MGHPLRDRGTPKALAEARQSFDFTSKIVEFERLREIVAGELDALEQAEQPANWLKAQVAGHLSFGFADVRETVPAVTGEASVNLPAVCQRCLEPFDLPMAVSLQYVLQAAGEQTDGEDGFEAWEMTERWLRPLDLIEETLIMALPLSAAHATPAECGPMAKQIDAGDRQAADTIRPFADLKAQLQDKN